jgi:23S rRNA pseudouridine1911/1915/1917 synthase
VVRFLVGPDQAGLRLDQFLAAAAALPRRQARRLVEEGAVTLDGRPQRILSRPVALGQVVEVQQAAGEPPAAAPAVPAVEIAYQDRWLLAAVKPAGVLSQPAERQGPGELALDQRLTLVLAAQRGRQPFLRLLHRIDRGASGLLLFAVAEEAVAPLAAAFREGRVERRYLALVEGVPGFAETRVDAPIGRDPGARWRFRVDPAGRPAGTRVRVLEPGRGATLVECFLDTGRTHQVRVHLAHLGHPVAGDLLYGRGSPPAPRLMLHAANLALAHPVTGRRLVFSAAPGEGFSPIL